MAFHTAHMLDFTNRKPPPPAFSLDRKDHLRRSQMRRREWRTVLMLPLAILAVAVFIHFAVQKTNSFGTVSAHRPLAPGDQLQPMAKPVLDLAPALPDPGQISAAAPAAAKLLASAILPDAVNATDPLALAYAKAELAADAVSPPIPQRLGASDLLLGSVRSGTPVSLTGQLVDIHEGAPGSFRRLLLSLDHGQWAIALSDADQPLTIGDQVQAVGRFLGFDRLPVVGGAQERVPLIVARVVVPVEAPAPTDPKLLPEWSRGGVFQMPENLFADLDDERTYIESRPYYYLLNQVRLEASTPGVFEHPYDLNKHGDDVHQAPDTFRDQMMKVRGVVYRAWEDPDVAQDKPFGISRVVRALIYRNDFGPITETIDGVAIRRDRLVERLFEVAMVTDQPVPQVGQDIIATGHFLKFHAIPVKADAYRDRVHGVERQSGNAYTYFLVTGPYQIIPPADSYSFSGLEIAIVSLILGTMGVFWFLSRKERTAADVVQGQVRRIRTSRQVLLGRKVAGGPVAGAAALPPVAPRSDAPATPQAAADLPPPPADAPVDPPADAPRPSSPDIPS